MRWRQGRRSRNVEDRRGQGPALKAGGFGGASLLMRFLPMLLGKKGGVKIVAIIGVVLVGAHFLGIDVAKLLRGQQGVSQVQAPYKETAQTRQQAEFISVVLADTEDTWRSLFAAAGGQYEEPKLVLFSGATRSGCGKGEAAMGPFYCPADNKVYIDLSFYHDLKVRHGAPGDFAQAYVIAHEVGHHVQNLLGASTKVHQAKQRLSQVDGNKLSVRLELQADCYAGLWAHHADKARQVLEAGDINEAITAAEAIGDDRLQKQAHGRVVPESFTHGTSEQRIRWFQKGFKEGSVAACDTFSVANI